jgi:hypothetical protein
VEVAAREEMASDQACSNNNMVAARRNREISELAFERHHRLHEAARPTARAQTPAKPVGTMLPCM